MAMNLRKTTVYALHDDYKNGNVRAAPMYVLLGMFAKLPSQEVVEVLQEQIRSLTEYEFQPGELSIGPPEVSTEHDCNTKILVTSTSPEVEGQMYFYYNRVSVDRLNLGTEFVLSGEIGLSGILPRISAYAVVPLHEEQFVAAEVINGQLEVKAAETGYLFIPGSKINILS